HFSADYSTEAPVCSAYCSGVRSSPSSVTSTVNNQPAPYGSSLIRSGFWMTSSLTSTTVPVTGEYSSETDLVDSSSPQTSPAVTVSPASGSSAKTTSPSWSAAYAVMPIRTGSSSLSHSCSAE